MTFIGQLKQLHDDNLVSLVFKVMRGDYPKDDAENIQTALTLYEGPIDLLRRLYRHLKEAQRETLAIAFFGHLGTQLTKEETSFGPITRAVLSLADPYLYHSSVREEAAEFLEDVAQSMPERRMSGESVADIHLAILNLRVKLDPDYWRLLASSEYHEDVLGVSLSGLIANGPEAAFDWLDHTTSSAPLAELLISHLPDMYDRARDIVPARLGQLIAPASNWDNKSKSQIVAYCKAKRIPIHRIAEPQAERTFAESEEPRGLPPAFPLDEPLRGYTGHERKLILTDFMGQLSADHEYISSNGYDRSCGELSQVISNYTDGRNLLLGVEFLRAKSLRWRWLIANEFEEAANILLMNIINNYDSKRVINTFVGKTPASVRCIVGKQSEYHEDRVFMRLFKELVEYSHGPRVELRPLAWGDDFDTNWASDYPAVFISAKTMSVQEAKSTPALVYEFIGYYVFVRKYWLDAQLKGKKLQDCDLHAKVQLALRAGVLRAGGDRFELDNELADFAGIDKNFSARKQTFSRQRGTRSEQLLHGFLKGDINVLAAGVLHSEMIERWLLHHDIEILLGPKDFARIMNRAKPRQTGDLRRGVFDFLHCVKFADQDSGWEASCIEVFQLISRFVRDLYKGGFSTTRARKKPSIEWAWRIFCFSLLGAEPVTRTRRAASGKLHMTFAPGPTESIDCFKYDRFYP